MGFEFIAHHDHLYITANVCPSTPSRNENLYSPPVLSTPVKMAAHPQIIPPLTAARNQNFPPIKLSPLFPPPPHPTVDRVTASISFSPSVGESKSGLQVGWRVLRTCREREGVDSASRLPDSRKLKCHDDFCSDVPLEPRCRTRRLCSI